jgi:hypothetical protein
LVLPHDADRASLSTVQTSPVLYRPGTRNTFPFAFVVERLSPSEIGLADLRPTRLAFGRIFRAIPFVRHDSQLSISMRGRPSANSYNSSTVSVSSIKNSYGHRLPGNFLLPMLALSCGFSVQLSSSIAMALVVQSTLRNRLQLFQPL